jgi:GAF domain-containing protein
MPYISCPHCAVTTYVVTRDYCPCCGTPLVATSRVPGPRPRAAPRRVVQRALEHTREQLRVDAVLLTEIAGGRETVRQAARDGAFPAFAADVSVPLEDTICRRLLEGRIGNVVGDVSADPELRDLPIVRDNGVGSYLGVPLSAADARLYVLCCLAREARPDLGDEAVDFVRSLCDRLRATLGATPIAPR